MPPLGTQQLPPHQLLAEVEDLIRSMPARSALGNDDDATLAWLGRAVAVVKAFDPIGSGTAISGFVQALGRPAPFATESSARGVITTLHEVRHRLRMAIGSPSSVAVQGGAVFDYFDELRRVVSEARSDILFVDPYLDPEFVSRYLPQVADGVTIRLLGRERVSVLLPAVATYRAQSGRSVELRTARSLHDRYVFVDRRACFQSGASFKDGARLAPTTITQITDAFPAVMAAYDQVWADATVQS
jgi:hypothetical protein